MKTFLFTIAFGLSFMLQAQNYYVSGNKVYSAVGKEVRFKGVNRPSLEWASQGKKLIQDDIKAIGNTCANIVRIPLNQDFWLKNTNNYQVFLDTVIDWCMKESLFVILDLHWSQKNDPNVIAAQQEHADEISLEFWYKMALKYKSNPKLLFELYNEPHKIDWPEIVNGGINDNNTPGDASDDWQMVGYQALYDTVRAAGANNLVIVGGNQWTFDLTYYETNPIVGNNILYATHCYPFSNKLADNWYKWTELAKQHPVIMTEFGPSDHPNTDYVQELLDTMDVVGVHWTAWAWYSFSKNNMWSTFEPSTGQYDTTLYGKWVIAELNKECKVVTSTKNMESNSPVLFPNPANNFVQVNNQNTQWTIRDVNGKIVLKGTQNKINVSPLEAGIYFYENRNRIARFVKR